MKKSKIILLAIYFLFLGSFFYANATSNTCSTDIVENARSTMFSQDGKDVSYYINSGSSDKFELNGKTDLIYTNGKVVLSIDRVFSGTTDGFLGSKIKKMYSGITSINYPKYGTGLVIIGFKDGKSFLTIDNKDKKLDLSEGETLGDFFYSPTGKEVYLIFKGLKKYYIIDGKKIGEKEYIDSLTFGKDGSYVYILSFTGKYSEIVTKNARYKVDTSMTGTYIDGLKYSSVLDSVFYRVGNYYSTGIFGSKNYLNGKEISVKEYIPSDVLNYNVGYGFSKDEKNYYYYIDAYDKSDKEKIILIKNSKDNLGTYSSIKKVFYKKKKTIQGVSEIVFDDKGSMYYVATKGEKFGVFKDGKLVSKLYDRLYGLQVFDKSFYITGLIGGENKEDDKNYFVNNMNEKILPNKTNGFFFTEDKKNLITYRDKMTNYSEKLGYKMGKYLFQKEDPIELSEYDVYINGKKIDTNSKGEIIIFSDSFYLAGISIGPLIVYSPNSLDYFFRTRDIYSITKVNKTKLKFMKTHENKIDGTYYIHINKCTK